MFQKITHKEYNKSLQQENSPNYSAPQFRKLLTNQSLDMNIDKATEIILHYVNIQLALCQLFDIRYGNRIDPKTSSVIGFLDEKNPINELSLFQSFFADIFIIENQKTPLYCQVKQPYPIVVAAFESMRLQKLIHPWILNLCLKPAIFDHEENTFYRWVPTEPHFHTISMQEDINFLNYLLHSKKNENTSCLVVSGLTMLELNDSPYISTIEKSVCELYLVCGIIQGIPYKTLTWVL